MPARARQRRFGALLSTLVIVGVLSGAALVATAPGVGAGLGTTLGPVDPTIADGDAGSLRDVVENESADGDTVVLVAGATYEICEGLNVTTSITIEGNGATIRQTCEARVVEVGSVTLTMTNVTVTGGDNDGGAGIRVDGGGLVLVQSTVTGNDAGCGEGGGIQSNSGAFLRIVQSTISDNEAYDDSAIDMDEGGELLLLNSTVSGNRAVEDGAISLEDDAFGAIVYSTVAANTTMEGMACEGSVAAEDADADDDVGIAAEEEPANLSADGDATARVFGSVIALPDGGPNCAADTGGNPPLAAESSGYNFSDDASCGLVDATDRQDAGNPGLGALAANGGPTLTHLPATGSLLIDAIPVAACGDGDVFVQQAVTDDQRGVVRPQGGGCDIGSVEVVVEAVIQPTFTG